MKKSNIKIFNIQYLIFYLFLISCSLFFSAPVFADETGCCVNPTFSSCDPTLESNASSCINQGGMWESGYCYKNSKCPQYSPPSSLSKPLKPASPTPTTAPASTKPATPEQNPMCWTQGACLAQWTSMFGSASDFAKGKYWESPGPGGICKDMGVCIPAGKTSLEISLPTLKTTTADLGDYIKAIYIFLISIGGIVAAVLIIKGGFEWVTSAGSPERVKSSQSTIGSALMGLLLLLGSYTLLYTINPDLVRLRLPGVYMIRQIIIGPSLCESQNEKVAVAGQKSFLLPFSNMTDSSYKIDPQWYKKIIKSEPNLADPQFLHLALLNTFGSDPGNSYAEKLTTCGWSYYLKNGNGQTCAGLFCPPIKKGDQYISRSCVPVDKDKYGCKEGIFAGKIIAEAEFEKKPTMWVKLSEVCTNGIIKDIDSVFHTYKIEDYIERFESGSFIPSGKCESGTLGYYLVVRIMDINTLDSADDYAVGCEDPNGINCSSNLVQVVNPNVKDPQLLKDENFKKEMSKQNLDKIGSYLISASSLQGGKSIEIKLNRGQFPND